MHDAHSLRHRRLISTIIKTVTAGFCRAHVGGALRPEGAQEPQIVTLAPLLQLCHAGPQLCVPFLAALVRRAVGNDARDVVPVYAVALHRIAVLRRAGGCSRGCRRRQWHRRCGVSWLLCCCLRWSYLSGRLELVTKQPLLNASHIYKASWRAEGFVLASV